ncbi:hypothetical protein HU830_04755 [Lactobacillus sp. DCY120]|uniref:Uncharacterized protein n=1 Tax=Bombilactobacillus apium TaxID=2675299 RepID=A0A850R2B0_9LACO|nr:hypothetical protein [Bombilactobacillus apium]NVY96480.1 hypothetical protein [Bombilactobacillus apium]
MKTQNAKLINGYSNGIFVVTRPSEANTVYQDLHVTNSDGSIGASPIRNETGKVLLKGENTFDILTNHDFNKPAMARDNEGEWIQRGHWVEVVDGHTTLNQNWDWDQPLYTYNHNKDLTLKIDDGANLL